MSKDSDCRQVPIPLDIYLWMKSRALRMEPSEQAREEFEKALDLVVQAENGKVDEKVVSEINKKLQEIKSYPELVEKFKARNGKETE